MGNNTGWPMAERHRQSQRIMDAVRRGTSGGLVIDGPAGIGKTRLVVETVRRLAKHGTPTLWLTATGAPGEHEDLAARIPAGRAVVAIDDAELLSEAAGALLARLATTNRAFLLCVTRGEKPLPAALTKVFSSKVTLVALSPGATADLLARVVGEQVDGAASYRLWQLSGGNPALLRRLVTLALDQHVLFETYGVWRLAPDWAPRHCLPDAIQSRVDGLSPEAHVVVQTLSLCGPAETALLERVFAEEALAEVDRAGLLEVLDDRRRHLLRLRNPLWAQAVRQAVPPLQARDIHRRMADALAATGPRRNGDATRLGRWRLAAGQRGEAEIFLAGAWEAASTSDFAIAERLAEAAEQNGGGFAATLALAAARYHQGRADDALADWPARATTGDEKALAALLDLRTRICLRGTPATATDPLGQAEIAMHQGRVADVLKWTAPLLEIARSPVVTHAAGELATAAAVLSGQANRAAEIAARELPGPRRGPRQDSFWRCLGQMMLGQLAEARAVAADGYRETLRHGVTAAQANWALARGYVALFAGQDPSAWLAEAVALMRDNPAVGTGQALTWALGARAEAAAVRGDPQIADVALAAADEALPAGIPAPARWRGRTWAASATGDLAGARRLALSGADALTAAGAHGFAALALHDAVRLGVSGRDLDRAAYRLACLVEQTDGELVPALAAHAAALRDRDGARLDRVAAAFADRGFTLFAAEAAAHACAAHQAAGEPLAARRAAARCHELSGNCDGVGTPALSLVAWGERLTPREREIATLAAQGRSSKAIADRLLVSVRTVDNHLHRAYTKLGVRGRHELSLALTH